MNADLTIADPEIVITMASPGTEASGSIRRSIDLGAERPLVLSIKHQQFVDSATKVPGTRSVVRVDQTVINATGLVAVVSAYIVFAQPNGFVDVTKTSVELRERLVKVLSAIIGTGTDLALSDEIFDLRQQ